MISVNADLSNLGRATGAIQGTLDVLSSPNYQGDLLGDIMGTLKDEFMASAYAARAMPGMKHMFEWGKNAGEVGDRPLFSLIKTGNKTSPLLTFKFLPSTAPVPPPSPKFGIDAKHLSRLRTHYFTNKALVMETQSQVTLHPKGGSKAALFIPIGVSADNPRGFVFANIATLNPGGSQATGGFATFWGQWFATQAPAIIKRETRLEEQRINKGVQTRIRSVGTGRFTKAQSSAIRVANAERLSTRSYMKMKLKHEDDFGDE